MWVFFLRALSGVLFCGVDHRQFRAAAPAAAVALLIVSEEEGRDLQDLGTLTTNSLRTVSTHSKQVTRTLIETKRVGLEQKASFRFRSSPRVYPSATWPGTRQLGL